MSTEFVIYGNKYRNKVFHFSGIGGVSMNGLAAILHRSGYTVQGSDTNPGKNLEELIKSGVKIFNCQAGSNLDGVDIFVRSLAIKDDNKEYLSATARGIPIISRHELLGEIMKNYRYSVAVSGTHGKTTSSSIIGYILKLSKLDPSINIGADLFFERHGTHLSESDYFVAEACEYGNSFHQFKPYIGVILNIEADHLDFFKDIQDVKEGFKGFASGIKENGYIVYYSGDANAKETAEGSGKRSVSFGYSGEDDYMAGNIKTGNGQTTFSVYKNGAAFGNFKICIPGRHNVLNSLCAIAVCDLLSIDLHFIKQGLLTFKGAARRLEYLGTTKDGIVIYDDYAHHPTEIKASLNALSEIKSGRLICAFQPHTYTRTKALFADFLGSFVKCDILVITGIYAAREKDTHEISSAELCSNIEHPSAVNIDDLKDAENYIRKTALPNDLIVSMGAGDIYKITYSIIGRQDRNSP
jgi:UDP-N-acetylmuramate--alanine ligase